MQISDRESEKEYIMEKQKDVRVDNKFEQQVNNNFRGFFTAFFLMGLINNSGYVMIGSAAQNIAGNFGMKNYMPSI